MSGDECSMAEGIKQLAVLVILLAFQQVHTIRSTLMRSIRSVIAQYSLSVGVTDS